MKRFLLLLSIMLLTCVAVAQGNDTCTTCHQDSIFIHRCEKIAVSNKTLEGTVHAKFACIDCHYKGHEDYPHAKFGSQVTCGECHEKELREYQNSTHYKALRAGNVAAADCTSCHTLHSVLDPTAVLRGKNVVAVCSKCHATKNYSAQFQLKPNVVAGFETSYHGQMYNLGFEGENYATCVSCHDSHSILGKDSPESTIARGNIVKTCAQCHKDANDNFVGYLNHYSPESNESEVLNELTHFMEVLFWGTMLVFGLHTLLWFMRTMVNTQFKATSATYDTQDVVLRFRLRERIMHLILVISFLTLAATGLPLKFSQSPFSEWIYKNIVGYGAAAQLHKAAGVLLVLLFVFYLFHLVVYRLFIKKETFLLWGNNSLVPQPKDVADFFKHMAYFLFLRSKPPQFDRWTYWEKFDYLAVFWGMFAIGISGIVLMFPVETTKYLPGWTINFAHIFHSEEALLATAFIFIVHFFNTHLRPGAFPIDDAIFTGRIPREQLKEERPLEYQRLKQSGTLDLLRVEPLAYWLVVSLRIMGLAFVVVGLALLILIITSIFHLL